MQEQWTSRRFAFDLPVECVHTVLSRLRGTQQRIAGAVRGLPGAALGQRDGGAWSMQEHVGHLHDLDALHLRRLDELEAGAATLSAADMGNRATWEAAHNGRPFAKVFGEFVASRYQLVDRMSRLDQNGLARHGQHPRLHQAMRAIDVGVFAAEHDDHHVARLEALAAAANSKPIDAGPAFAAPWTELPADAPMTLLARRRVIGREAMVSHITLQRGCCVPSHSHANEQFACVLSGRVRFVLADGERVLSAGDVLHLPSHAPHSAEALETAVVLDIFAPPSETTGIDPRPRR